jgi:hypothetical protein
MRFVFLVIILICLFVRSSVFLSDIHHIACKQKRGVIQSSEVYYHCGITISNNEINKDESIKSLLNNINSHVFNVELERELTYREIKFVRELPSYRWRIYMKLINEKIQELKIFNKTKKIIHTNKTVINEVVSFIIETKIDFVNFKSELNSNGNGLLEFNVVIKID